MGGGLNVQLSWRKTSSVCKSWPLSSILSDRRFCTETSLNITDFVHEFGACSSLCILHEAEGGGGGERCATGNNVSCVHKTRNGSEGRKCRAMLQGDCELLDPQEKEQIQSRNPYRTGRVK